MITENRVGSKIDKMPPLSKPYILVKETDQGSANSFSKWQTINTALRAIWSLTHPFYSALEKEGNHRNKGRGMAVFPHGNLGPM